MKRDGIPYGVGTIEPRRGRYRVRVLADGKYRDLDTVDTEEEAKSLLRGYSAIAAAGDVVTEGETLRDYGATWLDARELSGAKNIKTDRSRWALYVEKATFIDAPLATIGRRDVKAFVKETSARETSDRRGKRRISAQTVKHVLTLLRSCLQAALDDELIPVNPAQKVKAPKVNRDDGWTYLLPEEQRALLTCEAIPEPERMLIAFAIGSGLRQGEMWNLELVDLVTTGPHPHVMVRWGKPGHGLTKSGRVRRVPLFGIALAAARRWLQLLPTYARSNPFGLAFPTCRGCRRRDTKPPRGWASYLQAAGLADPARRHDGRRVRWHDLRHTCASSLVAGWWGRAWRLEEVRDVLGHTSITVTERYAHLAPGVLAEAARATTAELPTSALNLPQISPTLGALEARNASILGRATQDSNLRPSAPEADALINDLAHLDELPGGVGEILGPLAERYLRAVAGRNRFAHRYGVELADAVIRMRAAAAAPPAPSPAAELGAPARPGLARASALAVAKKKSAASA